MFTAKSNFSIISSAVRSRAAGFLALLPLVGALSYAQTATPVAVGYYLGSSASTYPVSNLVTNGSVMHLTHLNYAFADVVAAPNALRRPRIPIRAPCIIQRPRRGLRGFFNS